MELKIDFIKALYGDAILISSNINNSITNILIDGGPSKAFLSQNANKSEGKLKDVLEKLKKQNKIIDLLLMTHVDDDHIRGVIKAFEGDGYLRSMCKKVIFNSGRIIFEEFGEKPIDDNDIKGNFDNSSLTGIKSGMKFEDLITKLDIWERKIFKQGDKFQVGDMSLTFLSPDLNTLSKLLYKWEKEQGYKFTGGGNNDYLNKYDELLSEDEFKEDDSVHNGSSLAFILEVLDKKIILLGDAWPSVVINGLVNLGYNENNKINAELVKISHHGSGKNTNEKLIKLINSDKYVVTTNGNLHNLPNKLTFARIHKIYPDAKILFNYGELIDKIFNSQEKENLKGQLIGVDGEYIIEL